MCYDPLFSADIMFVFRMNEKSLQGDSEDTV